MKKIIFLSLLCAASFLPSAKAQNNYQVEKKIKLDGDGNWDYLTADEESGLLYISHGTITQVLNPNNGQLIATIRNTKGVHGIALAKDLGKGFTSNGKDTSVTVFDLKTFATTATIKVTGQNPDAILYDTFTHRVFVYNGRSANATVIDAATLKVIATISLPGKPEFSVSDGAGKVYVNIEDQSKVCVINAETMKVEQTWSLGKGTEPSGLALDNKNHRLFSVCYNKLMIVLDAQSGKRIAELPIGANSDGAAFDPATERAFSANGEGTLTVIQGTNGKDYKVLETLPTQPGARTITINTKTRHLYLPVAEAGPAPAATATNPHPRPMVKMGSFGVIDVAPVR